MKNAMKKLAALLMAASLALSLAACSSKGSPEFSGGDYMYEGAPPSYEGNLPVSPDDEAEAGDLIENEWISTAEEATSTFSSDVDTASYGRFRSLIRRGTTLEALTHFYGNALRTEEMLNYFDYTVDAPENGKLFGVKSEIAPCPWNPDAHLLFLTLRAKDANIPQNAGNNLVFLIDVSGSMSSNDKLPLLKKAFQTLVNTLTEKDTVSIVTYSGAEKVLLTGCPGNQKSKILKAVKKLEAEGSTNGSAGMERAYSIAADYFIEGGNNRIIMATDGDLNVGLTSTDEILSFVEQKKETGVYITTLGFGADTYNDAMLETIADNGNGAYYFIDGESEAEKVFGSDLLSTLYTVAEDVKLQLTFNPEAISEYRLVGYENRVMSNEDFENDRKDAGEVGSGERLAVCYELKFAEGSDAENLMTLRVRYKDPGQKESQLNEYTVTSASRTDDPSEDFRFASAVVAVSMVLHQSRHLGLFTMTDAAGILSGLNTKNLPASRLEFVELVGELLKTGPEGEGAGTAEKL